MLIFHFVVLLGTFWVLAAADGASYDTDTAGRPRPTVPKLASAYLIGKGVDIFASGSRYAFVGDAIDFTYETQCVRPYNGAEVLIPDQLCTFFVGAQDKTIQYKFVHARTMKEMSIYYYQKIEFDLSISLISSVDLLNAGSLSASFESETSYKQFSSVGINAFIGSDRTSCYTVKYDDLYPLKPTAALKKRIQAAPLEYDPGYFTSLISDYVGTHVILAADVGGELNQVSFAGEATMYRDLKTDENIELAAKENLWITSASAKDTIHVSTETQSYQKLVGANYNLFVKGPAPGTNDIKQYQEDVCADEQPVHLTLYPLPYFLVRDESPALFEMSKENLTVIADNVIRGMNDYCKYKTCYSLPDPIAPVWDSTMSIKGGSESRIKLAGLDHLCVLTEARKLTYAHCRLSIGAYEKNDATKYWYLSGGGNNNQVCSARCSKAVSWQSVKEDKPNYVREYSVTAPGGDTAHQEKVLEPVQSSFCSLSNVDNQFTCSDRCTIAPSNGHWTLSVDVTRCFDNKHMKDKNPHTCNAYCVDTKKPVEEVLVKAFTPASGMVPLTLANETVCSFRTQVLSGSLLEDTSSGGGCILSQDYTPGKEGVYWIGQAMRPGIPQSSWCYDSCVAVCVKI